MNFWGDTKEINIALTQEQDKMLYILSKEFADGILIKRNYMERILNDDKITAAKSAKFEKAIIKLIKLINTDEKLKNDKCIKEYLKMIQYQFSRELLKNEAETYCNIEQDNKALRSKQPYVCYEITLMYSKYRRLKKEAKENNMTLKKYIAYYIFEKDNWIFKPLLRASLCELNERIKECSAGSRKIEKEMARLWKLL